MINVELDLDEILELIGADELDTDFEAFLSEPLPTIELLSKEELDFGFEAILKD
jgi:hypothetical protein